MLVVDGLRNAAEMAYEVWWALVFGFAISAIVQAWVPRSRIERALGGSGARPVSLATALGGAALLGALSGGALGGSGARPVSLATARGVASSSCSYAAVAIAKSLFVKRASAASALALQFASTNLVWELGLVLWILLGWQFALAEFAGGLVMIALMALALRAFVSPRLEARA